MAGAPDRRTKGRLARQRRSTQFLIVAAAALGASFAVSNDAQAGSNNWVSASGGDWGAGGNWSLGAPPGPADTAFFFLGSSSPYPVTVTSPQGALNLQVDTDSVNFNVAAGQQLTVGSYLYFGALPGDNAVGSITGSGTIATGADEYVGLDGIGQLTQYSGTQIVTGYLTVADAGPGYSGTGTFNLAGGSYTTGKDESTGWYGTGTFIQAGGINTDGSYFTLGEHPGAFGVYDFSAGSLSVKTEEDDGYYGTGVVNQTGGTNAITTGLFLGDYAGSLGTFNLSNGTLSVGTNEYVGDSGAGLFNQTGGTHTIAGALFIAAYYGSQGTFYLRGGSLSAASISVNTGGIFNQTGGSLSFTQFTETGGAVSMNQLTVDSATTATSFNLSGGTLSVSGNELIGYNGAGGSFTQTGGIHSVTGALTLAALAGSNGSYTLGGGNLSAGTVVVNSGGSFTQNGGVSSFTQFNQTGGTVSLNPLNISIFAPLASYNQTGGSLSIGSGVINIAPGSLFTLNGSFSGSGTITENGGGTWRLTQSHSFSGSLVLNNATLSLAGASGALPSVSSIDIETSATLELNSTSALGGNQTSQDRINNSASIILDGGTVSLLGANGLSTTETLGTLVPDSAAGTISVTAGTGTGSSSTLTLSALGTRSAGASINFAGTDIGNSDKVFISSGYANGAILGGWATVNNIDFAKYSSTQGVIPFASTDYTVNTFTTGANVKLDPSVTSPAVPASVGTVSIATLNINAQSNAGYGTLVLNQSAGSTLTLSSGGLIKSGSNAATIKGGTLTSGSGDLNIAVTGGPLSLVSAFSGNLVVSDRGTGNLIFAGTSANTYTGATLICGNVELDASAVAIPGDLIIDGGSLLSLASNQLASNCNVTINTGSWNLNGQTETVSSFANLGGTMQFSGGVLNVTNAVTLAAGKTIMASTLNSSVLITVSGGDNEVHPDGLVNANAMTFVGSATPAVQVYSDNSTPGRIVINAGGSLNFTGTGTALLESTGTGSQAGILDLNGSTNHVMTVAPGATMVVSTQITNGGFTIGGGGSFELLAASNYSGGTTVNSSTTLIAGNFQALGASGSTVTLNGGTLALRSDASSSTFPYSANAASTNSSVGIDINRLDPLPLVSAGTFTINSVVLGSGNAAFTLNGNDGGTLVTSGVVLDYNPAAPGPAYIHNYGNLRINGPITCSGGVVDLIKDQSGTLTLGGSTGDNIGNLNVSGGTVQLSSGAVAVPGNLTIRAGSTVNLLANNQINPSSLVTIDGTTGSSLLFLNTFNNTFGSGGVGGLAFLAGGTLTTTTGTATLGAGVTYSGASGTAFINGNLNLGSSTPTFNVSSNSSSPALEVGANISGGTASSPVGLTKTGSGLLYLTGTNSFTGPVTISNGVLQIDNDVSLGTSSNMVALQTGGELRVTSLESDTLSRLEFEGGSLDVKGLASDFTGSLNIASNQSIELDSTTGAGISIASGGALYLGTNGSTGITVNTLSTVTLTGGSAPYAKIDLLPAANQSNRQLLVITSGLAIAGTVNAWQGKVDLANNDLDLQTGSLSTLTNQIKQGYAGGTWNGTAGITSSSAAADTTHLFALGVIQNNQSGTALFTGSHPFDGTTPGTTDLLVKYTYYGDTNLSGGVDGSDYSRIDAGYLAKATGWFNGDFNFDGVVNGSDYTLIDNAFNTQGAVIAAEFADASAIPTAEIASSAAVPEPASFGVVGIAFAALLGRRPGRRGRGSR